MYELITGITQNLSVPVILGEGLLLFFAATIPGTTGNGTTIAGISID
ncbi:MULTISPECIES: hypothetical protein [Clostridium]|nr:MULTISPECIES: hypothetical protein [Clostridium]MCR1951424.1 hypothetical protein [Clostridium sp. DSM 100503]MDI9215205.1 hypothetical protein [Clostridium tertium]